MANLWDAARAWVQERLDQSASASDVRIKVESPAAAPSAVSPPSSLRSSMSKDAGGDGASSSASAPSRRSVRFSELLGARSPDVNAAKAALQELLSQTVPVHLISTPFSVQAGYDKAAEVKADNHNPPHMFCYNPNTDAPQDSGGGWLDSWMRVCKHTKETQGTVYIVFNRAKNGQFGLGKHKGWFDGQAQGGEVQLAETLGCTISWVGY